MAPPPATPAASTSSPQSSTYAGWVGSRTGRVPVTVRSREHRSRLLLTASLVVAIAVGGCGGSAGDALEEARAKTLSARHLVVSQSGGRVLYFSPGLTVIKKRGRVLAWTTADEEFTRKANKRCYQRHTDFTRDDVRDQRRAVAPPDVPGVDLEEDNGVRVLAGREKHMDYADTEFEARLDDEGRLAEARYRSARFGVLPASRWATAVYRYPTAEQFRRMAGPPPRPRC